MQFYPKLYVLSVLNQIHRNMKKIFKVAFVSTMFALLALSSTWAQSIVQTTDITVVYNNSQSNSSFQDVSKFYFSNDNLVIDQHGIETNIPLSTIRRLELEAITTGDVASWDENTVLIYPNPTSDHLYFSAPQQRDVLVTIYSLSGQLLHRAMVNTSESVDVSSLSKGIYVIKIDEQTYKFTKL